MHDVAALCRGAASPHFASDRVHRLCLGCNRDRTCRRRDGIRPRRGGHIRVSARRRSTRRAPDLTVRIADAPFGHHAAQAGEEDRKHSNEHLHHVHLRSHSRLRHLPWRNEHGRDQESHRSNVPRGRRARVEGSPSGVVSGERCRRPPGRSRRTRRRASRRRSPPYSSWTRSARSAAVTSSGSWKRRVGGVLQGHVRLGRVCWTGLGEKRTRGVPGVSFGCPRLGRFPVMSMPISCARFSPPCRRRREPCGTWGSPRRVRWLRQAGAPLDYPPEPM